MRKAIQNSERNKNVGGLHLARVALPVLALATMTAQPILAQSARPAPTATATPLPSDLQSAIDSWQTPRPPAAVQGLPPAGADADSKLPPAAEPTPVPIVETVLPWTVGDARDLLRVIEGIRSEGLMPADYYPTALKTAIAVGAGPQLDEIASRSFSWLVEDLRDGRTPMTARVQWFAVDPDQDEMPTATIMQDALANHTVSQIVSQLAPTVPDYVALKEALAATPAADKAKRALIRANMDRWRWLKRDLGEVYLLTNVPEFQLRLTVKNKNIRTYKTVVGKPGRTATPQLAETVTAVVFNPTWTVPQSIVKGEGLGAKVLGNPGWAAANGYKGSRAENGFVTVVQQPGPNNALGLMKIDMPNPHAIYLHDTPAKSYFDKDVRAFSHGCIRTERAVELGMTMAILGAQMPAEEAADISRSKQYTKVSMTRTFPVYITYFTVARSIDGELRQFDDLYGRDKPVLASFDAPRELKTTQRASDEEIIKLDNPL